VITCAGASPRHDPAARQGWSAKVCRAGHRRPRLANDLAASSARATADHPIGVSQAKSRLPFLRGRVRLHSGGDAWHGRQGDLLPVPAAVHGLQATEDAVVC
jgi:hypothetical protein